MPSTLYEKDSYISDLFYLTDHSIYEYDIRQANINILKPYLGEETYEFLKNTDRETREVTVGKMLKNSNNMKKYLAEGFYDARKKFCLTNNIDDGDILIVAKDSFFIIDRQPEYRIFGSIDFRLKHTYSAYYDMDIGRTKLKALYSKYDNTLKLIGMQNSMKYHEEYFISFLKELFDKQSIDILDAVKFLTGFTKTYMSRRLSLGYYRELNPESIFRFNENSIYKDYSLSDVYIDSIPMKEININFNAQVLRKLHRIFYSIFFKEKVMRRT